MSEMAEKQRDKKGDLRQISLRCSHVSADGRRCKQKVWRGKGVCYQHDPEAAELRAKAGRPAFAKAMAGGLMTVAEVQGLLAEALGDLRAGRIKPGEAYAVGYLAQLALTAIGAARKVGKLDVKHFWDVVELGAAIETAEEMKAEMEKEKEAEKAKAVEPQMNPSTPLPSPSSGSPLRSDRAGADEHRSEETSEEEDDSEEEGVLR